MESLLLPELWEQIFQLVSYRDCENAYNTCILWRDTLESSKSSWLFGQALPLFLEHLSKSDLLQCRRVCKYWLDGVDYFLENNGYHRPAFEMDSPANKKYLRGLPPHRPFSILRRNNIAYGYGGDPTLRRLLSEATTHPRCPLVGRSIYISESPTYLSRTMNIEFLKAFGGHIWSLRILFINLPAVDTLQRIVEILGLVPNLKRLSFDFKMYLSRNDIQVVTDAMLNFVQNELGEDDKQKFTKLETLLLDMTGYCGVQLGHTILGILPIEKVQTLEMNIAPIFENFQAQNIVHLAIPITSEAEVLELLRLTCPVRSLALDISGPVNAFVLAKAVKQFQTTLQNFEVTLSPGFYDENKDCLPAEHCAQLEPFTNRRLLQDCKSLKAFTLTGCRPLSMNFLCGLSSQLECLTVFMKNMEHWGKFLKTIGMMINFEEEMDLLDILQRPPPREGGIIYKSNVWKFFPRLKVITIHYEMARHESGQKVVYRRDVYDKFYNT